MPSIYSDDGAHDGYGGHKDKHKYRDIAGYGSKENTQLRYYGGEEQYIFDEDQHTQEFEDTDEDQNNSGKSSGFELHTDREVSYLGKSKLDTEIDEAAFSAVAGSYGNERASPSGHEVQPNRRMSYFPNAQNLKTTGGDYARFDGNFYGHQDKTGAEFMSPSVHEDQPPRPSNSRMFPNAKNLKIEDDKFMSVDRGFYDQEITGAEFMSPSVHEDQPPRPSNPRRMFENAEGLKITEGNFTSVGRDFHVNSPRPLYQQREALPPRSGMRGSRGKYWAGKILPIFLTTYLLHLALLQDIHILPELPRVRVDPTNERMT